MRPWNPTSALFLRRAIWLGSLGLLSLSLTRCLPDRGTGESGVPTLARISARGVLPPNYNLFANNLTVDQIRLTVVRPPSDTLARLTRAISPDSSSVRFVASVLLRAASESLLVVLEYQTAQGVTLFTGQSTIEATGGSSQPVTPTVPLTYSGPGNNIAALNITPQSDTLAPGDSVVYQVTAMDSSQQAVTSFYLSWSTDDSRVPVNASGVLRAPDIGKLVTLTAQTPNGVSATATVLLTGQVVMDIVPDSVEKLPNGTQQFQVSGGPVGASFTWSVNGVDGGNTTFGTVSASGFYQAPAQVPNPAKFPVCARVTGNAQLSACATVVISPVPSAGADVIVFNDVNIFDNTAFVTGGGGDSLNNDRLVRNLVQFTSTGSRNNGNTVISYLGHSSICGSLCSLGSNTTAAAIVRSTGMTLVEDTAAATLVNLPANVKVLILWLPGSAFTRNEINSFKQFSGQGGRIIFVGEHAGFYGTGIPIENQFLLDMGAVMTNTGGQVDCGRVVQPSSSLRQHQVTNGMTAVAMGCASVITLGPNDFALWYDMTNQQVLAGVAKVDLTPLPAERPEVPNVTPAFRVPGASLEGR